MKNKKILWVVVVLVFIALAFPLSNLIFKPQPSGALASKAHGDFVEVAKILETKCAVCHIEGEDLPFYATLPIANDLIESDVKSALAHLDLLESLKQQEGEPVSKPALAMVEYTLEEGRMPPSHFLALHWNGGLSSEERETVLEWIAGVRAQQHRVEGVAEEFVNEPVQPLPLEHGQDPKIAALGDKMFHDVRLSGDNTLSCASCHGLDKGGTDQAQFSTGIDKQVGDINSPTVFNSGLQFALFWDGRAPTLQAQADGPVNNPIEMGSNWDEAMAKLKAATEVVEAFAAVFPDGLTPENVMASISVFEKTLLTPSRFDQYLRGDASAIADEEKQGYELFKAHACATCHSGPALGGCSYEKMGLKADYFADRGGDVLKRDNGRFNVTGEEKHRHRFKVPTLRNVEVSYPYFHDGTTSDLKEAVMTMAKYQSPKPLSEADADLIVAFLKSLTGEYNGQQL